MKKKEKKKKKRAEMLFSVSFISFKPAKLPKALANAIRIKLDTSVQIADCLSLHSHLCNYWIFKPLSTQMTLSFTHAAPWNNFKEQCKFSLYIFCSFGELIPWKAFRNKGLNLNCLQMKQGTLPILWLEYLMQNIRVSFPKWEGLCNISEIRKNGNLMVEIAGN